MISDGRAVAVAQQHIDRCNHPWAYHVALMVRKSRIISIGINYAWNHAEEDAIGKCPAGLRKECVLYSIRISKGGKVSNAKPCKECQELIEREGIQLVMYSNELGNIVQLFKGD